MKCSKCGAELVDGAVFCMMCGTKIVLNNNDMSKLSQIKSQAKPTGAPVWDSTPNGSCDCAVGECDCDGSIWS